MAFELTHITYLGRFLLAFENVQARNVLSAFLNIYTITANNKSISLRQRGVNNE